MTRTSNPWQPPGVVFNPATYQGIQRGINQLVAAIRPTLGPLPRFVVNWNDGTSRPELLDNGALIARRIIQLPNREADMGAMYLRHLLWRLHETTGDGTATAAVLFGAVYNHGLRYVVAGGDAMRLRRHLEAGANLVDELLASRTQPIAGAARIARLAETVGADPDLSEELGAVFDIIGPYGRLDVRAGHGFRPQRQYTEGNYWDSALFSPFMINDPVRGRAALEEPVVLLSDIEVHEPQQLVPALEAAFATKARALLLVVKTLPDTASALLTIPQNRERLAVAAVKTPGGGITAIREALHDLGVLTGARPLIQEAGDKLEQVRPEDLGRARRAWADAEYVGIVAGRGDPIALRRHVAALRIAHKQSDDPKERTQLLDRIGRLLGGAATLWVGGLGPTAIEQRKEQTTRTTAALRGALRDGVLPGGGAALLDCVPALQARLQAADDPDERAAYNILIRSLQAPAHALWQNAGFEPSVVRSQLSQAEAGYGLDVLHRDVVAMADAGIVDSAAVVQAAAYGAITSAALALTIDVLVHRANPPDSGSEP